MPCVHMPIITLPFRWKIKYGSLSSKRRPSPRTYGVLFQGTFANVKMPSKDAKYSSKISQVCGKLGWHACCAQQRQKTFQWFSTTTMWENVTVWSKAEPVWSSSTADAHIGFQCVTYKNKNKETVVTRKPLDPGRVKPDIIAKNVQQ